MMEGPKDGHSTALAAFDRELYKRPYPTCGRPRKKGRGLCTQPAGWRTVHVGKGACFLHGGIKHEDRDKRLRSGIYSTVSDVRLATIIAELETLANPLDVVPELTLARAILVDWTERFTALREAVLAWNASRGGDERPGRVPDLQELTPLLEAISRIVFRIERATSDKYIPRGQFYRVMQAMGRAVNARVHDERVREQILEDWLRIEVP
jgi:hypothetical protein